MKNKSIYLALIMALAACDSDVLDQTPQDQYSDAAVWTDVNLADGYLMDNYNLSLPGGFNYISYASLTDESHDTHGFDTENWLSGNMTASNTLPFGNTRRSSYATWPGTYPTIQKLNIFLQNIDDVASAYPQAEQGPVRERVEIMKGEAIFLRAFCYSQLLRNYGGLVIVTEPFEIGSDYLSFERSTFKESVDFIAAECDVAAALLLGKSETEMGRASKGVALALKSRVLLFAASDLTADGTTADELVGYGTNPDRQALWLAAKQAAKAVMDLDEYSLADFGAPDRDAVATNFYSFFKAKDLSSSEVIWGKMYALGTAATHNINLLNGPNGLAMYGCNAPTANLADAFQMADGSAFADHYDIDADGYYRNHSSVYDDSNIYHHREPRFYASILYDGALFMKRFENLATRDPIGIYDRKTRITIQGGAEVSRVYGIDTRQSSVVPDDGGYTGYLFKKYLDDEVYGNSARNNNAWIELRYAEVLLNYAEACIGLNEMGEAAMYINMVRNRVGLPAFIGDTKKALMYERQVEFVYEDVRWYDIRRWKILDEVITNAMGVDIVEVTNKDNNTTSTTWRRINIQNRGPVTGRMYWVPIPIDEINRAPQLQQNPGF